MSRQQNDILSKVQKINVNFRNGRRSPHKPLLLLLAIGRQINGHERYSTFEEIEGDLNGLIRRFGLPDSRQNAYHPFWHLRNDEGLWQIDRPELVRVSSSGDAYKSDLRKYDIRGGLDKNVARVLKTSPSLVWQVVQSLLNDYIPDSLHGEVMRAVGLERISPISELSPLQSEDRSRDRRFREVVLTAYGSRCAVCEFDLKIDENTVGIEAAHIKWHFASGPASVCNGMALCVLHHKLFDLGLFTVSPNYTVILGRPAEGRSVEKALNRYGGTSLKIVPDEPDHRPATKYLEWHRQAVFRPIPL